MTVVVVQRVGQFYSAVSSNNNIATVQNAPTLNNHLVGLFGFGLSATTLTGIVDSAGNTWQVDKTSAGVTNAIGIGLASCRITSAMTTSTTITSTWGASGTRKVAYVLEVSGLAPSGWFGSATALQENAAATSRTTSNALAAVSPGDLILGLWALNTVENAFTSTSPFTAWPAGTAAGYFAGAAGISVEGNYYVTPDTASYTPAVTTARSNAYMGFAATYKQSGIRSTPHNPAVNYQNPGWMMKAYRPGWRPRRSGLLVPGLALPQPT